MDQLICRVYRKGQTNDVKVYFLCSPTPIDQRMLLLSRQKADTMVRLLGKGCSVAERMNVREAVLTGEPEGPAAIEKESATEVSPNLECPGTSEGINMAAIARAPLPDDEGANVNRDRGREEVTASLRSSQRLGQVTGESNENDRMEIDRSGGEGRPLSVKRKRSKSELLF